MAKDEDKQESRMRWLFVGRFSPAPAGAVTLVTAERAARPFEAAPLSLTADVADRLGGSARRSVSVTFGKLSDLKTSEVVRANAELSALRAVAEELGAGRRDVAAAASDVEAKVGPGRLADGVRAAADGGSGDARKRARDLIERAVLDTARDALAAAPVAGLEAAWRGLRLVAERTPADVEIAVLDTDTAEAAARIEAHLGASAPFDRADTVFVVEPVADLDVLRALAIAGADYSVPVVVEGAPALVGAATAREVPLIAPDAAATPEWTELRADDAARWCCVVLNRLVVGVDGAGAAARVVFGSPTFGLAALLSQSYVATGGPGRIFAGPGALVAPGTWEVDNGRGDSLAIALEAFVSIDAQSRLAARGVLALGGPRNSDRVQISAAPTLSSAKDAAPVPAHLLTARMVRFAQWTRDQIPADTSDTDVVTIMEQAATALLFPNPDVARLSAVVTPIEGGKRAVVVRALARGEWVGQPLDVTFALPLPV
jgi:type VI secretion system protein ImpC